MPLISATLEGLNDLARCMYAEARDDDMADSRDIREGDVGVIIIEVVLLSRE